MPLKRHDRRFSDMAVRRLEPWSVVRFSAVLAEPTLQGGNAPPVTPLRFEVPRLPVVQVRQAQCHNPENKHRPHPIQRVET